MSAHAISHEDWVQAVARDAIGEVVLGCLDIHPAGRETLHCWLQGIFDAAGRGDLGEVQRLADMCRERLAHERA
jgi:hypothetical protein